MTGLSAEESSTIETMILLLLILGLFPGQARKAPWTSPDAVTVCEIAAAPAKFDGKVVRIDAVDSFRGSQQFGLHDDGCRDKTIWLELPETYKGKNQFERMWGFVPKQTAFLSGEFVGRFSLRASDPRGMVLFVSEIKPGSYVTN